MIQAIETHYKGYRFRSRLEARWAVFFDVLGIEWQYEPEGYNIDGVMYLPDFYLPQVGMFAEIKPAGLSEDEIEKVNSLAYNTNKPVLMLIGVPDFVEYVAAEKFNPSDKDVTYIGYSLLNRYLDSEHRFPCMAYTIDHDESTFGTEYKRAVISARSARFEHGEAVHA